MLLSCSPNFRHAIVNSLTEIVFIAAKFRFSTIPISVIMGKELNLPKYFN